MISTPIQQPISRGPELPSSIHEEFEKEPSNYPGIPDALHDDESLK